MKKSLVFLLLVLFTSNSFAKDTCPQLYDLSYAIMQMRQMNKPISEQMSLIGITDHDGLKGESSNLLKFVVISAYEQPRFETKGNKEKSAKDFANYWTTECYKQMKKK